MNYVSMVKKFLAVIAILAVTALCYSIGLSNYFLLDDGVNLTKNPAIQITDLETSSLKLAATSGNAGLGSRPISMLTFALNHYISGLNAKHFKFVNLLIHLLNGLLVFVFFKWLLNLAKSIQAIRVSESGIFLIALSVTTLWLLQPLNLTAVLYVVQRMTSLSGLFVLCGLVLYVFGRKRLLENKPLSGFAWIGFSIFLCTPLAILSKENGILLPFFLLLIEVTLLRWQTASFNIRKILMWVIGLSTLVPAVLGSIYLFDNPALITAGYQFRDFTLVERLMTEARVLWLYLYLILLPNISLLGLYHDDVRVSTSLLAPITTLLSVFGLGLLLWIAIKWRLKQPILAFGIGFFFIGHLLESTIFPLELVYEHRNYIPAMGILVIVAYYVMALEAPAFSLRGRLSLLFTLAIVMAGTTALRAHEWSDPFKMRLMEVQRHPQSPRAHASIAGVYDNMPGDSNANYAELYLKAAYHYQQAADLSASDTTGLFGLIVINARRELPIDESTVDLLESKLKTVPLGPPNINALIGTQRCYNAQQCSIDVSYLRRLFDAALSNPTLHSGNKSMILMSYSMIVFSEDKKEAIRIVQEAVNLTPHLIENRLAFVDLLIASGDLDSAEKELQKTKSMMAAGTYKKTINALERRLNNTTSKSRE